MKNEPVAYFRKNYDGDWVEAEAGYEDESIPLYTHPHSDKSVKAKTLTDEEMEIIAEALLMIGFKDNFINYDLKEKAQAILRKAQEK